jgi:hypothetical protein
MSKKDLYDISLLIEVEHEGLGEKELKRLALDTINSYKIKGAGESGFYSTKLLKKECSKVKVKGNEK